MAKHFVLLTRLILEEAHPSFDVEERAATVKEKIAKQCPDVSWTGNYAILGPWDYVDIFQAPDIETAMNVAAIIRTHGGAYTEVWPALEWHEFKKTVRMARAA